uniref:Lachesin n=1 Tax=Steinernema glaseri TaxID=37863 RepID=A0A1I7Z2J4_9BILA
MLVAFVLLVFAAVFRSVCSKYPIPAFIEPVMLNVTAIKGEDVEFRCKIENLGRHMVAFIKADVPPRLIAFDERVFRQRDKYEIRPRVDSNEWVLKIKNVQEADIGAYSCQLNTDPVISRIGHLTLKIPPTVSRTTASAVEVREGHNVTLRCNAHGSPEPTVIWRRQDRQIIRFNGATGYGASVYNGSELRLSKVSRKHMSEYVCVASNGIPPDESWTVKLHVTFEPIVIPKAKEVSAALGSLVRLVCNVDAWPRPSFSWTFNGKEIYNAGKYSLEHSVSEKYKTIHILEIKEVGPTQFGTYRCAAKNDNGKHFADITLREAPSYKSNSVVLSEGSAESGVSVDDDDSEEEDGYISVPRPPPLVHTADDRALNRRAQHHDTPDRRQHELRQDAEDDSPSSAAMLVGRISASLIALLLLNF